MKLSEKVNSKLDKTIKYVFKFEGQFIEFSYIDNGSGKDIICVPCQTMCNMSCTFCHLTDYIGKIPVNNLDSETIVSGVEYIVKDLQLGSRKLLISYMGCGEPLDNIQDVFDSMNILYSIYHENIRFGLATMLPKSKWREFFVLTQWIKESGINLKIHLSLHFTDDKTRLKWMPAALDIKSSIDALSFYRNITGNQIEVHYTIMDKVNDDFDYVTNLELLMRHMDVTIKFMRFSEKEGLNVKGSPMENVGKIMNYLGDEVGFDVEYYEPPGLDTGSSCGVFLLDKY